MPFAEVAETLFAQPAALTDYLCHWSRGRDVVYVETPKVACTTVKRVLQAAEGTENDTAAPMHDAARDVHDRAASPLLSPSSDPAAFLTAMTGPDTFRFAFVRNPYTRALSCWLDKMVGNPFERRRLAPLLGLDGEVVPSFADFLAAVEAQPEDVRDPHWATQSYLLRPQAIRYDVIGRFETFRRDFLRICAHLGIGDHALDLPTTWHATGAGDKVADHVGPEEARLVRRIYDADFRDFGYGWNPAFA